MNCGTEIPTKNASCALPSWAHAVFICCLAFFFGWLLYSLGDKEMQGFIRDDATYLITSQAISMGKGAAFINLPGEPLQNKYPLLYPLWLSIGWFINPSFPENIPVFLFLTVFFSFAAFIAVYYFLRNIEKFSWNTALLICFASFTNLYYASYASALMSEGMYLFFSVAALYMAEKLARGEVSDPARTPHGAVRLAPLIIVSACVFHTRIIGITLIAAIVLKLCFDKKFKLAMIYGLCTACLTIVPWQLFQMISQRVNGDILGTGAQFLSEYFGYGRELAGRSVYEAFSLQRLASQVLGDSNELCFRLYESLFPSLAHLVSLGPAAGTVPAAAKKLVDLLQLFLPFCLAAALFLWCFCTLRNKKVSVTGLYVALYLCVIIAWGLSGHISRFICVLLPFFWMAVLARVKPAQPSGMPASKKSKLALAFWLCLPAAALPANLQALQGLHTVRARHMLMGDTSVDLWAEYTETIASLKAGTTPQAVIGAKNDKVLYLYTGRKAFPLAYPDTYCDRDKVLADLLDYIHKNHVFFLVMEPEIVNYAVQYPYNRAVADIIMQHPGQIKKVYTAPDGKISVFLYDFQQNAGPVNGPE